jgi:hypothetical protein
MKLFDKSILAAAALLLTMGFVACNDANEFEDVRTDNPAWGTTHPDSLAQQVWVRGEGIKFNAYGEEVQGFVERMEFVTKDSVVVTMSEGKTAGIMGADDSNTRENPYEYEYTNETGDLKVLKLVKDDKGNISKVAIFVGVAVSGTKHGDMLTVVHYGDTPAQTYLVRK